MDRDAPRPLVFAETWRGLKLPDAALILAAATAAAYAIGAQYLSSHYSYYGLALSDIGLPAETYLLSAAAVLGMLLIGVLWAGMLRWAAPKQAPLLSGTTPLWWVLVASGGTLLGIVLLAFVTTSAWTLPMLGRVVLFVLGSLLLLASVGSTLRILSATAHNFPGFGGVRLVLTFLISVAGVCLAVSLAFGDLQARRHHASKQWVEVVLRPNSAAQIPNVHFTLVLHRGGFIYLSPKDADPLVTFVVPQDEVTGLVWHEK